MEIYKFIKPLMTNLGTHNVGERLYKEPYESVNGTNNYYPIKGGYPIWDRNISIQDYIEKVTDTDKPKEYYINKKYTQEDFDKLINK